tara:strand:- start:65 stop:286 length:222 start_codon:yes stop_codon:yes gene_type:complete
MEHLSKITEFFNSLVKVLLPIVSVSILLGVIFGPDTAFVGDVYTNIANILSLLGEDALLALVSIVIILTFLKK